MTNARKMWALDSPTFTLEASMMCYGGIGKMTIPVPAFLIEHEKGLVLFDSSIVPEAIDDPTATYGDLATAINISGTSSQRLDRQIEALGFKLSDVTHVIASHLHFDHAGGFHLFPDAKFYIGRGEFSFAHHPEAMGAGFYMPEQIARIKDFDWTEVPGIDVDLFGDGSLTILSTPGHTPGQLSLMVRLASRTFILTGDAVHSRADLQNEFHFPADADSKNATQTLRRLKLIRDSNDATVWISHDSDDWAEFKHAPHYYE